MSNLLLHLSGNKTLNRTVFPPNLYIYDDLLLYKKRKLLSIKEITISYNQISQVTLNKGIFFASLEIVTTGTDDLVIKYISKKDAVHAKKIIDQKIYHSHAKHHEESYEQKAAPIKVEKSIARLQELLQRGNINQSEFEKRKKELLNSL